MNWLAYRKVAAPAIREREQTKGAGHVLLGDRQDFPFSQADCRPLHDVRQMIDISADDSEKGVGGNQVADQSLNMQTWMARYVLVLWNGKQAVN